MSSDSSSLPGVLQYLLDLGLVQADLAENLGPGLTDEPADIARVSEADETFGTARFAEISAIAPPIFSSHRVASFNDEATINPAGSLGAGFPQSTVTRKESPPKKQPPLFWKAMGFFLKKEFSSAGSLLDADKAVFFANPRDVGIAGGTTRPEPLTNYQVFQFADDMQRANRPSFSLNGNSYFEFLNLYMRSVGEENESGDLVKARQTLLEAKASKDAAWESARLKFINSTGSSGVTPPSSLIDYINNDLNYKLAWNAEEAAQANLEKRLKPEMASLLSQVNLLRLADMRLEFQRGNNMPVIAIDADWVKKLLLEVKTREMLVDPKSIYYRPSYTLPGYEAIVNTWYDAVPYPSTMTRSGPHTFPLAGIFNRKWADLGHPLLDRAELSEGELTEAQKDFINSLSATLTFVQEPFVGNVSRGPWDVNGPRGRWELHPRAPQTLRDPVFKTTKLIIAWGIEIELSIPEVLPLSLASIRNITLAGMDLPLKEVAGNGNKLVFSGGGKFPILVGAFADLV